ncbi:GntR family transcriptional regulator [Rhodobacteraceae bacterium WD3A24]|nr:GntR family transcriptional regulator [Rhodobacteraceae bacterium WD3A24]
MEYSAKTETAFDLLRRDILNGTHLPGTPLRVAALSKRYGVSATPLREALSRLAEKQLVVASANRGWRVAPVSMAEFEDLQRARLTVETGLLMDAIDNGGLDWEGEIVAAHYRLTQVAQPIGGDDTLPNRKAWLEAHDAFHMALLAAARSNWLRGFYAQTAEQLQRHHQALLFHTKAGPGAEARHSEEVESYLRTALSVDRHTELMRIVLDRDRARAQAALHEHIEISLRIYQQIVGEMSKTEDPNSEETKT